MVERDSRSVSTPRSSNRAGGFPAPGFRTRLIYDTLFTRSQHEPLSLGSLKPM